MMKYSNMSILNRVSHFFKDLVKRTNVRKLELRKPDGRKVFSIALSWAIVIGLAAFFTNTLFIIAIAAVVLLIMKYQIVVIKEH
ncbi:MAG: DUF4342 domain-containing protein [Trueperaceae bacterium]|nr:DUF4342 domain-containing protein [Trueperaceae bacterium]